MISSIQYGRSLSLDDDDTLSEKSVDIDYSTDIEDVKNTSDELLQDIDSTHDACHTSSMYLQDMYRLTHLSHVISTEGIDTPLLSFINHDNNLSKILGVKIPTIDKIDTTDVCISIENYISENDKINNVDIVDVLERKIHTLATTLDKLYHQSSNLKNRFMTKLDNKTNNSKITIPYSLKMYSDIASVKEMISDIKYNFENLYDHVSLDADLHQKNIKFNKAIVKNALLDKHDMIRFVKMFSVFSKLNYNTKKIFDSINNSLSNVSEYSYNYNDKYDAYMKYITAIDTCINQMKVLNNYNNSIVRTVDWYIRNAV